jgi:hypothetical protein
MPLHWKWEWKKSEVTASTEPAEKVSSSSLAERALTGGCRRICGRRNAAKFVRQLQFPMGAAVGLQDVSKVGFAGAWRRGIMRRRAGRKLADLEDQLLLGETWKGAQSIGVT